MEIAAISHAMEIAAISHTMEIAAISHTMETAAISHTMEIAAVHAMGIAAILRCRLQFIETIVFKLSLAVCVSQHIRKWPSS